MNIGDIYKSLRSVFDDWSPHFLYNANYIHQGKKEWPQAISWNNYARERLDDILTVYKIAEISDKGQYTFQVFEDDSIFQLYYLYDYDGNDKRKKEVKLQSATLAFYSSRQYNKVDEVSWLRIDYDPYAESKGILHHDCHLHLSSFPNSHFVVASVPTPKQFVELIATLFYPEIYKKHRKLDETGQYIDESKIKSVNTDCFPMIDNKIYNYIFHFCISMDKNKV